MNEKDILVVRIDDRDYRVRLGDQDPAYIRELAGFLDKKIREIHEQTGIQGEKLLMLVALNLSDEILKGKSSPNKEAPDKAQEEQRALELLQGLKKMLNDSEN